MKHHIKSMDTLRAIAILTVVVAHAVLSYGAPAALAPLQLGGTGVDLFFVLSGWLLGCLLFRELVNKDTIDIKRFWYRRWMRTLPAYYAVLLANMLQAWLTKPDFEFPWGHFLFIQNYQYPLELFSVSWSLAVEEQFYLFIAPLLMFLGKVSRHTRTAILFTLMMLPSVFRFLGWYNDPVETHVRLDGCIMGVFLASIRYQYPDLWDKLANIAPYAAFAGLLLYCFSFVMRWYPIDGWEDPGKLVLAFVFGSWVLYANSSERANLLYFPGAYYIATRSYSLYLLHPEVLAIMRRFADDLHFVPYLVITLAIAFAVSELLYRLIELPFMELRSRFKTTS